LTDKVLVFGHAGQVARALAKARAPFPFEFAGRDRLDLADPSSDVEGLILSLRPLAVINAAAYTAVDGAESDLKAAFRLNRDRPEQMAKACGRLGAPLVHFSTDYVFDGEKGEPYVEADPPRPINAYGRSKAEGEAALEAVRAERGAPIAIVRTAWVFAAGGTGFLGAMLRAAQTRDEVSVVADQFGSPTPASACAESAIVLARALIDKDGAAEGLFHAAGRDGVSRLEFAEAIFRGLPKRPRLLSATTADFPTPAARPRDTRLDSRRLETAFGWRAPALDEALATCLGEAAAARDG
jgi:dTDP-4-dehydrorhamnose reductase